MKIKICGMRGEANIQALSELKPDYMGLIFYPLSKRFVNQANASLPEDLSDEIKVTGVFVNESHEVVLQKVKQYHLKAVQLHGEETPGYCHRLRRMLEVEDTEVELIKAFGIDEAFDFKVLEAYNNAVDFFLFDTKTPAHGGSGLRFNWQILKNYDLDRPYFLSGGIGLDDLNSLKLLNDYRLYAVDLNSKFETSPGLKDIEQVSRAINILRSSIKEG
jgi:phosphoribosylanthranilate isomerase